MLDASLSVEFYSFFMQFSVKFGKQYGVASPAPTIWEILDLLLYMASVGFFKSKLSG